MKAVAALQGCNVLSKILETNRTLRTPVAELKFAPTRHDLFLLVHRFSEYLNKVDLNTANAQHI